MKHENSRYDLLTRLLHWIVAAGIIYAMIVGYSLHFISNPVIFEFFSTLNMSLATVIALLMMIRFVWRFFRPSVPYTGSITGYKKSIVILFHEVFYLVIFLVLISGFLMLKKGYFFFGLFFIPQPVTIPEVNDFFFQVHRYSCISLGVMLLLHVFAVIKHQFIGKTPVLSRMK